MIFSRASTLAPYVAIVLIAMGCGPEPTIVSAPQTPSKPPVSTELTTILVSFFSPGDGTDIQAAQRLDAIVASLGKSLPHVTRYWGLEGEHDECFDLEPLSPEERRAFVNRVREEVGSSDRVNIRENVKCGELKSKPTVTGVGGGGQSTGKPCSILDSNGPLKGGTSTTKGCATGEICVCNSRGGYSCQGTCAKAQQQGW